LCEALPGQKRLKLSDKVSGVFHNLFKKLSVLAMWQLILSDKC